VANRTNAVMQRLTIVTTLLMTPTLVAGIYGMNFEFMPELHWANGYPLALVLMLLTVFIELVVFRRLGYL
jgi:magnesium transporter